jgi:hypothetical protein
MFFIGERNLLFLIEALPMARFLGVTKNFGSRDDIRKLL